MAALDDALVREYLEQQGFAVQPRLRRWRNEARVDFLIHKDRADPVAGRGEFILYPSSLRGIRRAIVSVAGGHTETFTVRHLRRRPELFAFLAPGVLEAALEALKPEAARPARQMVLLPHGRTELAKLLVLPNLPEDHGERGAAIALLRERGVDGVILFRSVLLELVRRIESGRHHAQGPELQLLRLLRVHGLLGDPSAVPRLDEQSRG